MDTTSQLRSRMVQLARQIDNGYWELGECLHKLYDYHKVHGRKVSKVFSRWGYKGFTDFCERELNLKVRTAMNLRAAYDWFGVHLALPPRKLEQYKRLGRVKLYLLAGVVQPDTVDYYLAMAQKCSFRELEANIYKGCNGPGTSNKAKRRVVRFLVDVDSYEVWNKAIRIAKGLNGSENTGDAAILMAQYFIKSSARKRAVA